MRRLIYHALILGGLLGLLVGCGEIGMGGSSISGTVTAPAGVNVAGTTVFACYNAAAGCDRLGESTLTQSGSSAPYSLGSLPQGSYAVIAIKTSSVNGEPGTGDLYGYFGRNEGPPRLVTPPQANVNIELLAFTGKTQLQKLPETLRQAIAEAP